MKQVFQASWIAPMNGPIIRDGAVNVVDGRIASVGAADDSGAVIHDLGDVVLLPGLINAHTHLELSEHKAEAKPRGSFGDWLLNLRSGSGSTSPQAAATLGIAQSLRFGVTTVGDITQQADLTRPIVAASPIRCVSYGEVLGLAKRRARFDQLMPRAVDPKYATPKLRVGLSPHAPYTVDLDGYRQCLALAKVSGMPLATHLGENVEEKEFLESQTGMFRRLWEQIGSWNEGVATFKGSPIAMAQAIGLLDHPTLLAHVNYCDDDGLAMLARGQASVVYCPRTHRYFGHPPHRWREMLARGINVAVGTDSCASSPDLNLVEELRLVRSIAPEIPATRIWELATIRAARALSMDQQIGSIEAGKRADFVGYKIRTDDPLEEILAGSQIPESVWIDGEKISRPIAA